MRRLFWLGLGAVAGVLVVRKITRSARAFTPEGLGRSVAGLTQAVREAGEVVREAMAEREEELREALQGGADAPGATDRDVTGGRPAPRRRH